MKIYCEATAWFKDHKSKFNKDKWNLISFNDLSAYKESGFETKCTIGIFAIDEKDSIELIKSRDFIFSESGKTRHNISFMGNTFQFDGYDCVIVCLNKYIAL